ncbi:MAG: LysE family translocator [Bacteroidales bacterium]|nr:LysE family translocator [Bacteroidales bacterium]
MSVLFEGMVLGFSLAFLFGFGPAFFSLIQTGIHRGFWAGALLAFGIFLNDAAIIVLSLLGLAQVFTGNENYHFLGIAGGIVLIVFGWFTFMKKTGSEAGTEQENNSPTDPLSQIVKGFLLNVANPFVWLFWIGISVGILARFRGNSGDMVLFFSATLGVVFFTDLAKTFAASQLKKFVTGKLLVLINKIAGAALIGFGIYLITRAVLNV